MIKGGVAKICGIVVTIPACPGIMIPGRRVAYVTIEVADGIVIKDNIVKITGIGMAIPACSGIMAVWRRVTG